jgi:dipeptidyl aminopeptidase/acylaminoacyl peptidase
MIHQHFRFPTAALFLVLACLWAMAGSGSPAAAALDPLINSLFAVNQFKQAAIAPNASRVLWIQSLHNADGTPSPNTAIYIETLDGGKGSPVRLTAGSGEAGWTEQEAAWSPDSTQVAFLSDAGQRGQLQLYVARSDGSGVRKLTHLTGDLSAPQWSPDGKRLAFLFIQNAPRAAGPLQPMTPPSGEIQSQIFEQRLAVADVASGDVHSVSPKDLYVYEYCWSPDGKAWAATAAHGAGDANWWVARLYTIDSASGEARAILKPPMQIAAPAWSPDGRSIAFIGGLMSDAGANGGDVFVAPAGGGAARDVTPNMKASASWLTWLSGNRILFTENVDGLSGVATVDPVHASVITRWTGGETISAGGWLTNLSLSSDGNSTAVIRNSFSQPPEVWAGPVGQWKQLTHANASLTPSWGKAESIHWQSPPFRVQGWLLYPGHYDPSRRYPMVVLVHGGPGSATRASWPSGFYNTSVLSTEGYFVFYPNPRGSFGQGEQFTRANVKDFGYGDLRDILAGVDSITRRLPVDPNRIGITGWSYGGFMTMWAVTQTHRFRAAVAGAGIANWKSYYGENDIDTWMPPFFGATVYDDPAVYAKSSPINFIKRVRTPTLVVVGDRDGECPAPQSFEFWHALKDLGVKTDLVVYPGEGHMIWRPSDRRDIIKRQVEWFNQNLR